MPYNIAGIDVHKKMLHVVFSDVEVDGEYQFVRRKFDTSPSQLGMLADWLLEQQVEEVAMESTAQYLETCLGNAGTLLEAGLREAGRCEAGVGNAASGAGAVEPGAAGAEEGFP
jgi:hypothetical protein